MIAIWLERCTFTPLNNAETPSSHSSLKETEAMNDATSTPPPSATHSYFECPNLSPADISTAADAEAVAAREVDDKGIVTTGPVAVDQTLARCQTSLKFKTAWLSSRTANKDEMSVVMDFAQNMDVPDLTAIELWSRMRDHLKNFFGGN